MSKFKYTDYINQNISFSSFLCKDGLILYKIVRKNEAHFFLEYCEEEKYYVVTCNKSVPKHLIEQYVKNNYERILNWYKNVDNPEPWLIFGQKVPVKVFIGNKFNVEYANDHIDVYIRHKRDYKDAAKYFYKQLSTNYLQPRTNELMNQLGLKGTFGCVRWATYYLGMCDAHKKINYSAKLIQYSKNYIDYVIYHEIAHFTHMNHKKEFWKLVESYCPNYKQLQKEAYDLIFNNRMW